MFKTKKQGVIEVQKLQVKLNAFLYRFIGEPLCHALSVCFISDLLSYIRKVILVVGILHMGKKLCAFSDKMGSASQKISCGPHLRRINICHGHHSTA